MILGVGLLGGSIGLAAKSKLKSVKIVGYGHSDGSAALKAGAVDRWENDLERAVRWADFILIATPVQVIAPTLSRIAGWVQPGTVVTDVGSAKAAIVSAGEAAIRPPAAFIGSHPMAGGSKAGVAAARADLFEGAACVVTPTATSDPAAVGRVRDFWQALGGRVIEQDPVEHDRLVALASHLPHALAAALMAVQEPGSIDIRGKGLVDTTRVAGGDPALWREIFAMNRGNVLAAVERLERELATFKQALANGDDAAVFAWLDEQAKRRNALG